MVVFDADATDGDHGANALILYYINSIVSDLGTNSTVRLFITSRNAWLSHIISDNLLHEAIAAGNTEKELKIKHPVHLN